MIESIRKNRKGISLMLVSSLCVCFGQLLWKLTARYGLSAMLLGFCLYGVGALSMLAAYRYGELSVLQPMLGLNYALSVILGATVLGEPVDATKFVGVVIIVLGVFMIAGGDSQ